MAELAALQRTFYERVTSGCEADPIVASGDLGIYARMYASRLHDALADDYPKVRVVLGDDAFAGMVARYLQIHRPRSYTLRDAGLELPMFLRHDGPPWLAELAALERARVEVFDGPDASPLAQAEVAALGLGLPELVLRLIPSSVVVPLAWAADELWTAIEDEASVFEPEPAARTVLVWRRNVVVLHRTLDDDEAQLAPRLAIGIRFDELCELLATTHGDEAAVRATELLLRWLQAEVLVADDGP
ncbi:MAG: putative DNA-binding domain-containing protein [Kofleriaceae bacterium]